MKDLDITIRNQLNKQSQTCSLSPVNLKISADEISISQQKKDIDKWCLEVDKNIASFIKSVNYIYCNTIPLQLDTISNVIFNNPATSVIWADGTKTVVKCQDGDTFNSEIGLAMCISKKVFCNNSKYNEVFNQWLPKENNNE